jgi:hypothetical protein
MATITVPKAFESGSWCSAARRTRFAVMSVSEICVRQRELDDRDSRRTERRRVEGLVG